MFPFNLPGPQFLLFYLAFALAVLVGTWVVTRMLGARELASYGDLTSDPYLIAYLRGGPKETVKVAVFNLVDRGLLDYDGHMVDAKSRINPDALRKPIDRLLISLCRKPTAPAVLLSNPELKAECDKYKADLERRGLLPDEHARAGHLRVFTVAVALLAGVAAAKIVIALAAGRSNIAVLVIFSIASCLLAIKASMPRVTSTGRATLSGLRALLKRLGDNASRLHAGGRTNEALLLAAVAGLAALPATEFAQARQLFPAPAAGGSGGDSSSSSCSSSSGCGGGGGCGGCGG